MTDILASFDLTALQWGIVGICALLIGMTKTGLAGAAMLVVPVLAGIFGGKPSVGLLLPMLCFGDVFGVSYYHRHTEWRYIRQLIPWALIGIVIALFVGN
ncbi:TSUP family transporter, partial [Candidatus Latescibacterota bacterium]